MTTRSGGRRRGRASPALVAMALAALTLAVFWPVTGHEFVAFDDEDYVTRNPWVRGGLTLSGLRWAFTSVGYAANWHPLTWISHMLDVSLFGLSPGWHHAMGLLLHILAVVGLLLGLRAATGALWRSAAVAALFAVHPLHVESVAWVAERKDVLSALLFFLALGAYVHYARRPGAGRYLLLSAVYTLGLLAKSMLVTLPLLLIALDWWPLGRFRAGTGAARRRGMRRLVAEKMPLLALGAGAAVLTYRAQARIGSLAPAGLLDFPARAANAAHAAVRYLLDMLWPAKLAVLYPYPTHGWTELTGQTLALSTAVLAGATALGLAIRRRAPALALGWSWYLVMFLPVSGLVHVGIQARADRYTYLPLVGIFIALLWLPPLRAVRPGRAAAGPAAAGLAVILLLASLARKQTGTWRSSAILFSHAVAVTRNNWQAHANLGRALGAAGRREEAVRAYREALRLLPYLHEQRIALGSLLLELGRPAEALAELQPAVRARPEIWWGHAKLGDALALLQRQDEAAAEYLAVIRLKPDSAAAFCNLGAILFNEGKFEEARRRFGEAVGIDPRFTEARYRLGATAARLGLLPEAVAHWEEVLRLDPTHERARRRLEEARGKGGGSLF